ncbi:MAG: hypothetical protein AAFO94_10120 [Bacteroidota bacterium]
MKNMQLTVASPQSSAQPSTLSRFVKKVFRLLTLQPIIEIWRMNFDFELSRRDLMEIEEEMYR